MRRVISRSPGGGPSPTATIRSPSTSRWRRARWRSPRCLKDGCDDPLVAGAATEVPGEALAHVLLGRLGDAAQQVPGGDEQPRGAEPALHGTRLEEGGL